MTRYELLDRIGVGGMAEIFRGKAVAAGGFEKPVAIKRILPHLSQDSRFVELLIAEAKVLSLLKHRNIVQIFDVGLGDDNQYFLVMEYVDGKDLGAVQRGLEVRRGRLPFDLALHIVAEICEALEHAHTARAPDGKPMSLVHRDVSPSNVLLSRAGEVKLTDFGIAKRAEQEATGHGAVRGKFAYISPEQARNEHIDPRSDVFSVGILLWELITHRRLFSGLGDLDALRAVRDAQVPRPSDIDPRLSPEIDQLLMTALARDITKRPTAGQLAAKLRTLRYSLEVTVGDPATELAKIIDTADAVQRESQQIIAPIRAPQVTAPSTPRRSPSRSSGSFAEVEHTEATVIRIRTADAFQIRDQDAGMARAREVIDRFDEEETRQAQLSGDQLRILRGGRTESSEVAPLAPPRLPGVTRPSHSDEIATLAAQGINQLPPNQSFDADENTRLVARSRDRRTPAPQRLVRPASAAPPMPPGSGAPDGSPTHPAPGTVHDRNPTQSLSAAAAPGQPLPLGLPPLLQPQPAIRQAQPPPPMQPPPRHQPPPPMLSPPQPPQPPQPTGSGHPAAPAGPPGPPGYPAWGRQPPLPSRAASPTPPHAFDPRAGHGPRPPSPQVAGFQRGSRRPALQVWLLVLGALIMAALAFVITRAFLA